MQLINLINVLNWQPSLKMNYPFVPYLHYAAHNIFQQAKNVDREIYIYSLIHIGF